MNIEYFSYNIGVKIFNNQFILVLIRFTIIIIIIYIFVFNNKKIYFTGVTRFDFDLNILNEENLNDEAKVLAVWESSFFHRFESIYKDKDRVTIYNEYKICQTTILCRLVTMI